MLQDIAPENKLGIPRNDRLIQIEEDVLAGHWGKAKRLRLNWNFKFGQSEGRLLRVKAVLCALGVMATPLHAQLYADVSTTMGDFTLDLYYEDSPLTVANFVSLAEGSRKWIDPATGIVQENKPYFNGIIFHRVINGFMNQVGSPQGTGSDGPGYVFPDEVGNGLIHDEAYLLSSANAGPQTNGSQMFITVDATPWLDGIHTVFGKVIAGSAVIDAINNVATGPGDRPVDDVSIVSITIRRVGAEANAFDVTAQGLPEVEQLQSAVEAGSEGLELKSDQEAGTTLRVFRAEDLMTWSMESRYLDASQTPLTGFEIVDPISSEFFRTAVVEWPPGAGFPSDLESWSYTVTGGGNTLSIDFSDPPTVTDQRAGGEAIQYDLTNSSLVSDGYGCNVLVFFTDGATSFAFQGRLGSDVPVAAHPVGRGNGTYYRWHPLFGWGGDGAINGGTFSMTPLPPE